MIYLINTMNLIKLMNYINQINQKNHSSDNIHSSDTFKFLIHQPMKFKAWASKVYKLSYFKVINFQVINGLCQICGIQFNNGLNFYTDFTFYEKVNPACSYLPLFIKNLHVKFTLK